MVNWLDQRSLLELDPIEKRVKAQKRSDDTWGCIIATDLNTGLDIPNQIVNFKGCLGGFSPTGKTQAVDATNRCGSDFCYWSPPQTPEISRNNRAATCQLLKAADFEVFCSIANSMYCCNRSGALSPAGGVS